MPTSTCLTFIIERLNQCHFFTKDKATAEELNKKFRNDISNYKVPGILEYVQETWNRFDLEKKVKTWERKVDIAEVNLTMLSFMK